MPKQTKATKDKTIQEGEINGRIRSSKENVIIRGLKERRQRETKVRNTN
jgi:hypothetical protein